MAARPTGKDAPASDILVVPDERMAKVVDEVDRFFQSVHLNIEDWKFSMEDGGDGTRIFVRFQIRLDAPGAAASSRKSRAKAHSSADTGDREPTPTPLEVSPSDVGTVESKESDARKVIDAVIQSDPDLPPLLRELDRKRERHPHVEFHKAGAPFVEAPPEETESQQARGDA
jgi:hypothetical protein